jgi:putative ABC transport system permease protein
LGHKWRVCGIVDPGKLVRVAAPRKTLQGLDDIHGMVTVVYIKADNPANAELLKKEFAAAYPNFSIFTMKEIVSQLTDASPSLGPLRIFTQVVIGIGVVIAFAVVCLAQYMAVLQRTREIGILKSLGAGKSFILSIILIEALALGIGGSILGVLTSFGAQWVIARFVPASIQMAIVYDWWPRSAAIILVAALLGSLYPGLSAASHDPIEALAYE